MAVEAVRDGAGKVTAYKLALRSTNKWDANAEQVSWDILQIDTDGRLTYGEMKDGAWKDYSIWGAKSISAYEKIFGQDLNLDGSVGIDLSKLAKVDTDTAGVGLRRDGDGGLYLIEGTGADASASALSGWLEYNNTWSSGLNKREAVAVESVKDTAGTLTGYILAMKSTNQWSGGQAQVTWDILAIDTNGKQTYGYSANGTWTDPNVYGAKSIASYEGEFGQDLNGDASIGIDLASLTKVTTDTRGVGLRRDRDNALYFVAAVNGTDAARAVGSNWLEYDNSWTGGSNKREAVAIEAKADGTGYRLALKQVNSWSGSTDTQWEVLTLDAMGKVVWNYGGGNFVTRKAQQVEEIVLEDLDGDGQVGVSLADLTLVASDVGADRLAWQKAESGKGGLYILEGVTLDGSTLQSVNRKVAVTDSAGTTPQLENAYQWFDGGSTTQVYAVARQALEGGDYQFRLAVKVERTQNGVTTKSWQIHTVSKDGVLDWSKVATTPNPDRFESLFNIDFNDDGKIESAVGTLTTVATDTQSVFLKKDGFGTLYIVDSAPDALNGGVVYIVDAKGGSPVFNGVSAGVTSQAYAVHQVSDGSYRLAVKKTSTVDGVETVRWEVHTLDKANASFEARIDWSKSKYISDVKVVETLIDEKIDADDLKGYAAEVPNTVDGDTGAVKAATNGQGHLFIEDPSLTSSPLVVVDGVGVPAVFEQDSAVTLDDGKVFRTLKEVLAAEAVGTGDAKTYKVMVKTTVSETGLRDQQSFQIYTVGQDAVVSSDVVDTPSPFYWEKLFNQDFTDDASAAGMVAETDLTNNNPADKDLGTDKYGAVYVLKGADYLPVLDARGANLTFSEKLSLPLMDVNARAVAAEVQDSGDILLAVQVDVTQGDETTPSWAVHTLKVNDAGDAAVWDAVVYYEDSTELTNLFKQDVAVVG